MHAGSGPGHRRARLRTKPLNGRTRLSLAGLLAANLVPALGIVFGGWSALAVVLSYVLETVVVGGYTLLRMAFAKNNRWSALFYAPFFVVHYGLFVGVQSVFLFMGAGEGAADTFDWQAGELFWVVGGFVLSHGQSFLIHYLWGGLYKEASPSTEMARPYARIFIQQFAAIFGFTLLGEGAMGAALIIVGLKTALDVWRHLAEHRGEALADQSGSATGEIAT